MKNSLPTARSLLVAFLVAAAAYGPVISALVGKRAFDMWSMPSATSKTCLWVLVFVVGSLAQLFAFGQPCRWRNGAFAWTSVVGPIVGLASYFVDKRSSSIATVVVPIAITTSFRPVVEEWFRGEGIASAIGAGAWVAFANLLGLEIAARFTASWVACVVGVSAGAALVLGALIAGAATRAGAPVLLRGLGTAIWLLPCAGAAFVPWCLVGAVTLGLGVIASTQGLVVGGVIFLGVYALLLRRALAVRYEE